VRWLAAASANAVWQKGDQYAFSNALSTNYFHVVYATKLEQSDAIASRYMLIKPSRRYEVILVGSHFGNVKMVLIDRGVSAVSP
jgi:hypothetical protein